MERFEVWVDEVERTIYIQNSNKRYCPFLFKYFYSLEWFFEQYHNLQKGFFSGNSQPPRNATLFGYITEKGLVYWSDI